MRAGREDFVLVLSEAVLVIVPRSAVSILSTIHAHEHELGCEHRPALSLSKGAILENRQPRSPPHLCSGVERISDGPLRSGA
jgi:hypothetical protein